MTPKINIIYWFYCIMYWQYWFLPLKTFIFSFKVENLDIWYISVDPIQRQFLLFEKKIVSIDSSRHPSQDISQIVLKNASPVNCIVGRQITDWRPWNPKNSIAQDFSSFISFPVSSNFPVFVYFLGDTYCSWVFSWGREGIGGGLIWKSRTTRLENHVVRN